jgi:hypothetical protein
MTTENTTDLTPSWEDITPALVEMSGRDKTKQAAWGEIRRMAQLADRMKLMAPALNGCVGVLRDVGENCVVSTEIEGAIEAALQLADLALTGRVAEGAE